MTVQEALNQFNTRTFRTSIGDNINRVCFQIYKTLDEKLIAILTEINVRLDWNYIEPGAEIRYFDIDIMNRIDLRL